MIIVQIHSGLGNQLFMYAAARALACKRRTGLYLDVDTDCREGRDAGAYVGHSFQLDKFNIKAEYLNTPGVAAQGLNSRIGLYSAVKTRLREIDVLRKAVRLLRHKGVDLTALAMRASGSDNRFFREERGDWKYKPGFLDLPGEIILRGCFLSYKYFDWMRSVILDELSLREELSPRGKQVAEQIDNTDSVSLHVRRRDVVTHPEYRTWYDGVLTEGYYRNALAHFAERLQQPHFFVFSDDMTWVRTHLDFPGKVTYVDHNGPERGYEDLHLMSRCKHNITAGFSSFSWWAGYLNRNADKTVVRTRRMNALEHLDHPQDFFPSDWVVMDS